MVGRKADGVREMTEMRDWRMVKKSQEGDDEEQFVGWVETRRMSEELGLRQYTMVRETGKGYVHWNEDDERVEVEVLDVG